VHGEGGVRDVLRCSAGTGQRGRRACPERKGQGGKQGLRQIRKGSRAVPEASGQVGGGPVYSEGGRRTQARQVFDNVSASKNRSSTTKIDRTRARS
jgi:hypothetical protein